MAEAAWLEFYRLRFTLRAIEPVRFPFGKAGNVLRGGFGTVLRENSAAYATLFEPIAGNSHPSGFREPVRPFVFRAAHLDAKVIAPGERFRFDLHLFETRNPPLDVLRAAFAELGAVGIGAARGQAELISMEYVDLNEVPSEMALPPLRLPLEPGPDPVPRLRIDFLTPTELKSHDALVSEPVFGVLFARARDRVGALRALNGSGAVQVDYRGLGRRAGEMAMTSCELERVTVTRRSSRTGQRHPLGGFIGRAEYEGDLREFLPWLSAAQFTGVGRQTAWGKGEIRVT